MQYREFGDTGIRLSALCFGSMRLDPNRLSPSDAKTLVLHLLDRGVTTFHSSAEYETHAFFCKTLRAARIDRRTEDIVHISKIAVPHFEEPAFTGKRLREHVDAQLAELGAERLDIVQWLIRSKPIEDGPRLKLLAECAAELAVVWAELQREGKVGALASFPYSASFAASSLRLPTCAGLVTYLNLIELEAVAWLDDMRQNGQGFVAIRPLAAGRIGPDRFSSMGIARNDLLRVALQFPLLHPAVASTVLSVSSIQHADAALDALADSPTDVESFRRTVSELRADAS